MGSKKYSKLLNIKKKGSRFKDIKNKLVVTGGERRGAILGYGATNYYV